HQAEDCRLSPRGRGAEGRGRVDQAAEAVRPQAASHAPSVPQRRPAVPPRPASRREDQEGLNMNFETRKNIVIGAGSLCIGLGAGYILAQKSLEKKYQAITEQGIQSVRESYRLLRTEDMESLRTIETTEVAVEETVISDDSFDGPEEPSDEEPEEPTEADVIELRSRVKDLKYWTPPKETEAVRNVREMLDEEIAKEQEEGDDETGT